MEPILQQRLKEISREFYTRFHYPGHKGRPAGFSSQDLFALDMTETYGTDNLLHPEEIIDQSQKMAAQAFSTLDTFYGVGGSTMAIYAAIFSMTQEGDLVLVQRNCHKSVYQAALLRKLRVRTIDPIYDPDSNLLLGLDPERLEAYLASQPRPRALVLTNPSYYGVIQDLKSLIEIAHKYGLLVLVDEAHGAHLPLGSLRQYSGLACGGDLVVHSAHKSLAALTQTALLHRNSQRISREKVLENVGLFTSTSPSYIFLVSIEGAICEALAFQEREATFIQEVEALKEGIRGLGYEVFSPPKGPGSVAYDYMKIFFRYPGYTGEDLSALLYEDYINLEMTDGDYCLAVLSQASKLQDFSNLFMAMGRLPKGVKSWKKGIYQEISRQVGQEIYQAQDTEGPWLDIDQARGRLSSNFIYQYPPGVPLVLPGEVFTDQLVDIIKEAPGLVGVKGSRVRVK